MQQKMRNERAPQKGSKEDGQTNDQGFAPLGTKDGWVQFGAGQEGKYDGAGSGQEGDPFGISQQSAVGKSGANDQLSYCTDDNLRQCRRHAEPDGNQRRDERETDPQC